MPPCSPVQRPTARPSGTHTLARGRQRSPNGEGSVPRARKDVFPERGRQRSPPEWDRHTRSGEEASLARCEGLALLGAKVLHRSGEPVRPERDATPVFICNKLPILVFMWGGKDTTVQSSFFFPSPRPSLSFSRCLGASKVGVADVLLRILA